MVIRKIGKNFLLEETAVWATGFL